MFYFHKFLDSQFEPLYVKLDEELEAVRTYVEFKINERNSKDENQTRRNLVVESTNVVRAKYLLDRNQPDIVP